MSAAPPWFDFDEPCRECGQRPIQRQTVPPLSVLPNDPPDIYLRCKNEDCGRASDAGMPDYLWYE